MKFIAKDFNIKTDIYIDEDTGTVYIEDEDGCSIVDVYSNNSICIYGIQQFGKVYCGDNKIIRKIIKTFKDTDVYEDDWSAHIDFNNMTVTVEEPGLVHAFNEKRTYKIA